METDKVKAEFSEAPGIAWTDVYTAGGDKISLTCRASSIEEAIDNLIGGLEYAEERGFYQRNRATDPTVVGKMTELPPQDVDFFGEPAPQSPTTPQEAPGADKPAIMGKDWGLVKYAPKKADLGFGDRFSIVVDKYKAKDQEIQFWQEGSQFPTFRHSVKHDYGRDKFIELFHDWKPITDGEMHTMPGGDLILEIQATGPDRQTKNGTPYLNLDGIRRP